VSKLFLKREYEKALHGEITAPCCAACKDNCGVCGPSVAVREVGVTDEGQWKSARQAHPFVTKKGREGRVLFAFSKTEGAVFLSHLNVMQIFERAFLRAGYTSGFTQGYNPKPRLEFAQPLSLGIASEEEIALAEITNFDEEQSFIAALNETLPQGLRVLRAEYREAYQLGQKKRSLMSLYWGSVYRIYVYGVKNREAIERLRQSLRLEAGAVDAATADRSVVESATRWLLRIDQTSGGKGNIIKVLEGAGLDSPLQKGIQITRIQMLARHPEKTDPASSSYFDLSF